MKDDLTPENLPKMVKAERPAEGDEQPAEPVLTDDQKQRAAELLREEQNLVVGAMAGFLTAVVAAVGWAAATVAAGYTIGWLAVGIGFATGFAVRTAGKGIDPVFGIVGAAMSLLGCVLGNVFTIAWYIAEDAGMPVIDVLSQMDVPIVIDLILDSFQVTDILFYVLAIYFGYRYSIRDITTADYDRALGRGFISD